MQVTIPGHICAVLVTALVLESWSGELDGEHSVVQHLKASTSGVSLGALGCAFNEEGGREGEAITPSSFCPLTAALVRSRRLLASTS